MTRNGMNLAVVLMTLGAAFFFGGRGTASEVADLLGATKPGEQNMVRLSDYNGGSSPSDGGLDSGGNWSKKDGVMTFVVDDAKRAKGEETTRLYKFVTPSKSYDFIGLQGFGPSGGGVGFLPVPESRTIIPLVALFGLSAVWLWRRAARGWLRSRG